MMKSIRNFKMVASCKVNIQKIIIRKYNGKKMSFIMNLERWYFEEERAACLHVCVGTGSIRGT